MGRMVRGPSQSTMKPQKRVVRPSDITAIV
jgi:hypothetical protein